MKMYKSFIAAMILVTVATNVNAQATATATASATVVTPISIVNNTNMNFGNIAVQASTGGTVALSAAASATRTAGGAGGVTLPNVTGTVTSAKFTVSGTANYTYTITLPGSAVVLSSGANNMNATSFINSAAGTLDGTGNQIFYVGATLTVAAAQPAGAYTTATPFNVTVNYN